MSAESCTCLVDCIIDGLDNLEDLVLGLHGYLYCLINLLVFFTEIVLLKNLVLSNMSKIVCSPGADFQSGEYRGRTDDLLHAMQAL